MTSIFDSSSFDKSTIRNMLKEAQEALHQIITGTKAVTIERNGRKVVYKESNVADSTLVYW